MKSTIQKEFSPPSLKLIEETEEGPLEWPHLKIGDLILNPKEKVDATAITNCLLLEEFALSFANTWLKEKKNQNLFEKFLLALPEEKREIIVTSSLWDEILSTHLERPDITNNIIGNTSTLDMK